MNDKELLRRMLGITPPRIIKSVELDVAAKRLGIAVECTQEHWADDWADDRAVTRGLARRRSVTMPHLGIDEPDQSGDSQPLLLAQRELAGGIDLWSSWIPLAG